MQAVHVRQVASNASSARARVASCKQGTCQGRIMQAVHVTEAASNASRARDRGRINLHELQTKRHSRTQQEAAWHSPSERKRV